MGNQRIGTHNIEEGEFERIEEGEFESYKNDSSPPPKGVTREGGREEETNWEWHKIEREKFYISLHAV